MHALFLLLTLDASTPAHPRRLVGCSEQFESRFEADWALEGVEARAVVDLAVTCLANGDVVIEVPSLKVRRTVNRGDYGDDVPQERIVAVIAAELMAEGLVRGAAMIQPPVPADVVPARSVQANAIVPHEPSPRNAVYSLQGGGSQSIGNGFEGSFQGAFIGVNRGASWSSLSGRTLATIEGAYEVAEVKRSLGTIRTRAVSAVALLGVESVGTVARVGVSAGLRGGGVFIRGLPTVASDEGRDLSAAVVSPMLRFTLSVPWRRVSMFARVDGGHALTKVRAHVVNDADAALAGFWCNVGIGILLSLN